MILLMAKSFNGLEVSQDVHSEVVVINSAAQKPRRWLYASVVAIITVLMLLLIWVIYGMYITSNDAQEPIQPLSSEENLFGEEMDVMQVYTNDQDRALALAQAAYNNAQQGKIDAAKLRAQQAETINGGVHDVEVYKALAAAYKDIDEDKYIKYLNLIDYFDTESSNGTYSTNATQIYIPQEGQP